MKWAVIFFEANRVFELLAAGPFVLSVHFHQKVHCRDSSSGSLALEKIRLLKLFNSMAVWRRRCSG